MESTARNGETEGKPVSAVSTVVLGAASAPHLDLHRQCMAYVDMLIDDLSKDVDQNNICLPTFFVLSLPTVASKENL